MSMNEPLSRCLCGGRRNSQGRSIPRHRNCSSGEGIFTLFSPRATDIVNSLHAVSKAKSVSHKTSTAGKKKMNPILAMLRSGGSGAGGGGGGGGGGGNRRQQQRSNARSSSSSPSTAARAKMSRSVSVVEEMAPRPTQQSPPVLAPVGVADEPLLEEKKKSASETNLLNKCEGRGSHATNAAGSEDGFYKSFDELADDIDDLATGVLASSNPLEASVVLRAQPAVSSAASSEATSSDTAARCSFNSSDSGRMSNDTYAETSNSSVASAASNSISSHCNRLCSNTSNCSGDDSGMSSSNGSGLENGGGGNARLEALRERSKESDSSFGRVVAANGEGTYNQIEDEEAR